MFIIERALSIFTLIYELEANTSLNESKIPRMGLESTVSSLNSVLDSSGKKSPLSFNTGFVPNQLVLNASLLNELNQESFSSSKNINQNSVEKSRKCDPKSDIAKFKQTQQKGSEGKSHVRKSSKPQNDSRELESEAPTKIDKIQTQSIPNLELSKIASPNPSDIQARQQNNVYSASLNNYSHSKNNSNFKEYQTGSRDRNIPAPSPRFVRVNSNFVDNSLSSHIMQNTARGGVLPVASPASRVYNNTNIQGTSWRTVWPNSNLMSNGGMGDALASPVSTKSINRFSPSSPQQMFSPTNYNQTNSNIKFTVTPNPSLVRYIEQKTLEGVASPIGFSPLASPTYRKNVSQSKSISSASPSNNNLNNLTFSYKG